MGECETSAFSLQAEKKKKFLRDYCQCSESFLNWYLFQETSLFFFTYYKLIPARCQALCQNWIFGLYVWSLTQKRRFSEMPPGHNESVRVGRGWMKRTGQECSQQWGEQEWRATVQSRHSRNLPEPQAPRIQESNLLLYSPRPPSRHTHTLFSFRATYCKETFLFIELLGYLGKTRHRSYKFPFFAS